MIEAGKTEWKGHGTVENNQVRFGGSGQLSKEIRRYTSSRLVRRLVTMMVALGLIPAALITGVLLMVSTRLLRNNAQIHAYDTLNQAYYSVRQLITEAESTAMGRFYMVDRANHVKVLPTLEQCADYLVPHFFGRKLETVFILCLDAKCKLLCCKELGEGGTNSAGVSIRKIVETAIGVNATTVVLAHNHPSGLAVPSAEIVPI